MGRDYYGILGVDKKASQDIRVLRVEKLTSILKGLSDFFFFLGGGGQKRDFGKFTLGYLEEETYRFEDLSCSVNSFTTGSHEVRQGNRHAVKENLTLLVSSDPLLRHLMSGWDHWLLLPFWELTDPLPARHFWVDDFPAFPRWDMLVPYKPPLLHFLQGIPR